MNYLLDTCVLSEFTKREPAPTVVRWMADAEENGLYLSVITIGEIQKGIERLSDTARKEALNAWLKDDLLKRFSERLVLLDAEVMLVWGTLAARMEGRGRPMPAIDSLIAASALSAHMTLVTRNEKDFEETGVILFNPWDI